MENRLDRKFFNRPTLKVAEELIGKIIVHRIIKGDSSVSLRMIEEVKGRIIETEAYIGQNDQACHARHGKTKRNEVMWGPAGFSYIYLCMGLHNLLNIVTEDVDQPAAVLIRKIEPMKILHSVQDDKKDQNDKKMIQGEIKKFKSFGPGNLTKYLKIDRSLSGIDITNSDELYIEDDGLKVSATMIERKERVGIDYAGEDAKLLWRFTYKEPNIHRINTQKGHGK